ncbi:HAD-IIA family hydrolase [Shinella sp. NM-101]|uniref:HAD-IIA family hydrolase n=1 Tax=Shinella sp. NM-101 TaxID=2744455 RepID=UPI001F21CAE7|nr:HAD hydrolase-like protein [Shinella sp. NM-101]
MNWHNEPEMTRRVAEAAGWVLDVDGCIVRTAKAGGAGGVPIEGAAELLDWLHATGKQIVVCTNASQRPVSHYATHLRDIGLKVADADMITAATAAAGHIRAVHGEGPVVVLGEDGLFEALADAGVRIAALGETPAAVVVGAADTYASRDINAACLAIADHGAAFYLTVDTPWFHGGAGRSVSSSTAVGRAVQGITGVEPIVCGKPSTALAGVLRARLGEPERDIVIMGDMASIEVRMAREMGALGVLVLSGGTAAEDLPDLPETDRPHLVAENAAALLRALTTK